MMVLMMMTAYQSGKEALTVRAWQRLLLVARLFALCPRRRRWLVHDFCADERGEG